MRGLKIQEKWIHLILNQVKTMEVRGQKYKLLKQEIALGNSKTKNVEGYAFIEEILKIPFSKIMNYRNEHQATLQDFQKLGYDKKHFVYAYRLTQVRRESNPFPYPRNPSIFFQILKCPKCGNMLRKDLYPCGCTYYTCPSCGYYKMTKACDYHLWGYIF